MFYISLSYLHVWFSPEILRLRLGTMPYFLRYNVLGKGDI